MIQITADTRRAVVTNKELLTVGSAGIQVEFTLSEDWGSLSKLAVFRVGDDGTKVDVALGTSLTCVVPPEVLTQEGEVLFIGIYGTNGQGTVIIPTVWASAGAVKPGTEPNTPASAEPTPVIWAQILGVATDAEQTAADAMSNVEAGLQELSGLENTVQNAEDQRQANEQVRIANETERNAAETERSSAENSREVAETERLGNETTRQNNESARVAAETARASAETSRASAEEERAAAEAIREANYATYVETVSGYADAASTSAYNASVSASAASTYAGQASASASSAAGNASAASSSATSAAGYATTAGTHAGTATTKAQEAAASAAAASDSATTATSAKNAAETAQGAAEAAQAAAEEAQEAIEDAAAQIEQNTQDIADLEDEKQDKPATAGTAGQVLGLDANLDPVWVDQTSGGVTSVNGKTGAVQLDAGDIEFADSETYAAGSIGAEVSQQKNAISDIMRGDRMLFDGWWLTSAGNWEVDNDRSFYVFPVSPNDSISIKSTSLAAYYTFLKTFSTPVAGVVADYATGYSNFVARGNEYTVTAPNDAHYFLLGKTLDGNDVTPIWARNGNYDYVKTTIDNYNDNASGIVTINSYPTAGYVNVTGGIRTGGTWVTTDFYPSENIKSIFLKAYQIPGTVAIASFYDVNKNFIYAVDTISGTSGNGEKSGYLDLSGVPSTARFVRFSTNDGATHYVVINYGITNIVLANYDRATEAQNNIISSNVRIETFNGNGFVKYVDGSINAGANWCYTDYLSAKNVVSMRSKAYQFPGSVALVAFYDEDKGFISAVDAYDGMTGKGVKEGNISISQIPANAVFMRFSSYVSADGKYVSVKYDYTQSMKELISVVPELQSLLRNFDIYGEKLTGYPFTMTFIGDSLTYGQTYVADQGTPNYAYKNKANYPDVFSKLMELDSKTVIAIPGANPGGVWSEKRSEISAIQNQFVIVWLGTNGGLTDTVDTDCVGDDVDSYANTNTGNYGKIVKTLVSNGNKVFLAQLCYTTHSATSNPVIVKLADRFGCSAIELTPDDIADLNQDKYHTAYNGYINSVHFNSIGYNHVAGVFFNKMMSLVYADPAQFEIYMVDT